METYLMLKVYEENSESFIGFFAQEETYDLIAKRVIYKDVIKHDKVIHTERYIEIVERNEETGTEQRILFKLLNASEYIPVGNYTLTPI